MIALYLSLIDEDLQKNKFEKLYYRYRSLMYYIAFQVLNNEKDSEDAVQEAFFRIAKNMDKIGEIESNTSKNFIAVIVKREAMKIYDKKKKRSEVFESELTDLEEKRGNAFLERCKAKDSDKMTNELLAAMKELPYKYYSIMILKYVMGYSGQEISQITGLSETNVRQHIFNGKRLLEEKLKEEKQ